MSSLRRSRTAGGDRVLFGALTLLVSVLAVHGYMMVVEPLGHRFSVAFSDYSLVLAGSISAFSSFRTARRSEGRVRRVHRLLGSSSGIFTLGFTGVTIIELYGGVARPFPTVFDALFFTSLTLLVLGMLSFPSIDRSTSGKVRMVLDGTVIATAIFLTGWFLVLETALNRIDPATKIIAQLLSGYYLFASVAAATIALIVLGRVRRGGGIAVGAVVAICVGVSINAMANFQLAHEVALENVDPTRFFSTGWLARHLFCAFGAFWAFRVKAQPERDLPTRLSVMLPYAAMLIAFAVFGVNLVQGREIGAVPIAMAVVLVGLVMVRQLILLKENLALTRELELRVHERTKELLRREERFRALVQNSTDVVTIVNAAHEITWVSPSIRRIFGFHPREVIGQDMSVAINPDDIETLIAAYNQVSRQPGLSVTIEFSVRHTDGRWCRTETQVTNLLDDANVEGMVLNTRDISDRKALEEELSHQWDPLESTCRHASLSIL